ncbi:MAG: trigger factor [Leadbetterella sp.]
MQSQFDKTSTTLGSLKVDISQGDYTPAFNKKINEYSRTAQVKGFRPGHVPVQYIKNIYGKGILIDEVIRIASAEVDKVIKDNNLRVVGEPTAKEGTYDIDWAKQKEFSFEYTIGFASEFSVDLNTLPVVKEYAIQPGPDQISETVDNLLQRFSTETEPESAEIGDLVFGNLSQESTEFFFNSGIPTDKVKSDAQMVFKGLEKGSKVSFDIQTIFETAKELGFATGKSDEDAAALEGTFELEVTKITRQVKGEISQEFYDKVLGPEKATDQASFESQLVDIMKENYARESDYLLGFEIDKLMLETYPIELPDAFVKDWLLDLNKGKASAEDVEKEYPQIAKGLKLDFIKSEIAKQEDIKIEYADMLEEVKSEIRGYFGGGGFEGMEDFIHTMAEKQLKEKKGDENRKYFEKAFGRKVSEFVKSKVKKETKEVTVAEFTDAANKVYEQPAA